MMTIELETLVGEHELTAVDVDTDDLKPANGLFFTMDGVTYKVEEDEQDGYRSSMQELQVVQRQMRNVFPACKVLATYRGGSREILDLTDVKTGKVVLSIGTDNTDDYYPWFVAEFDPTAMAINARA